MPFSVFNLYVRTRTTKLGGIKMNTYEDGMYIENEIK